VGCFPDASSVLWGFVAAITLSLSFGFAIGAYYLASPCSWGWIVPFLLSAAVILLLVVDIVFAIVNAAGIVAFTMGKAAGDLVAVTGPMFHSGLQLSKDVHRFLNTAIGDARAKGHEVVERTEGGNIYLSQYEMVSYTFLNP
jgi:hypothetical protein